LCFGGKIKADRHSLNGSHEKNISESGSAPEYGRGRVLLPFSPYSRRRKPSRADNSSICGWVPDAGPGLSRNRSIAIRRGCRHLRLEVGVHIRPPGQQPNHDPAVPCNRDMGHGETDDRRDRDVLYGADSIRACGRIAAGGAEPALSAGSR